MLELQAGLLLDERHQTDELVVDCAERNGDLPAGRQLQLARGLQLELRHRVLPRWGEPMSELEAGLLFDVGNQTDELVVDRSERDGDLPVGRHLQLAERLLLELQQ